MSLADDRSEIQKAIQIFEEAARAGKAEVIAGLYAETATLLPPGSPPIRGRQNIRNFWQAFLEAGAKDPVIKTNSVEASGDLAYEIGEYHVTLPAPQGGTVRQQGKYLVAWKRQPDGTLKMVADMFSPNS